MNFDIHSSNHFAKKNEEKSSLVTSSFTLVLRSGIFCWEIQELGVELNLKR